MERLVTVPVEKEPNGIILQGDEDCMIRGMGLLASAADIRNVVVATTADGTAVPVADVPGMVDVACDQILGQPQVVVSIACDRANRYGINSQDVLSIIETSIGGLAETNMIEGERRFPLGGGLIPGILMALLVLPVLYSRFMKHAPINSGDENASLLAELERDAVARL